MKISCAIICKNEERIIQACLEAASQVADEIILVDSGSDDRTLEIAAQFPQVLIYHQTWQGYGKQKNYALSLCKHPWILSLDADEILSPELIQEIQNLNFNFTAYQIPRRLFINQKLIKYGGYFPDYQTRLFQRQEAAFKELAVHESIELQTPNPSIHQLKSPINHYAYDSIEEMQNTYLHYAKLGSKSQGLISALIHAVYNFNYKYFLRLGFLDGKLGLRLAYIQALYAFQKYH